MMTTERQIAANRLNGRKSTGPKSRAGKQRTRNNAYRHGFAAARGRASSAEIEELAFMFAAGSVDPITMEQARVAAHAHIELANLTAAGMALIERAYRLGFTEPGDPYALDIGRILQSPNWQELLVPVSTMPPAGPERLSEAIRRALPELARLQRYIARAIAGRDRAVREIASRKPK